MNTAIDSLAMGAVRALLKKGVTDANVIRHEALLDCLPVFVEIMGWQPTWQEVEQIKKAIEESIKYHTPGSEASRE